MTKELIKLAKHRLEKARNTLSDARKFIGGATLESTVNRIYYAMFHAVNALLIAKGLSSSKHSGVRALFNREIVNTGLLEKQWGRFYSELFNSRQEADYMDFVEFKQEDVELWLEKAGRFIDEIEVVVTKIIS